MQEQKNFCGICVSFCEGEEVKIIVSYVEVLKHCKHLIYGVPSKMLHKESAHTLMPSSEKQGGTAEDSSSASDRRIGNFSTADIGMSPR